MASNVAPRRGSGHPTHSFTVAAAFVTTDLLAVSKRPQHAPQRVEFKNGAATQQNAVYTLQGDSGTTTTPVEPGQTYPVDAPVASLDGTSGDGISAVCYWFHGNGIPFNS